MMADTKTVPQSYRFAKETLRLVRLLGKKLGIRNRTAIFEMAIKRLADSEGIR